MCECVNAKKRIHLWQKSEQSKKKTGVNTLQRYTKCEVPKAKAAMPRIQPQISMRGKQFKDTLKHKGIIQGKRGQANKAKTKKPTNRRTDR